MDKLYKKCLNDFNGNEKLAKEKLEIINKLDEKRKSKNTESIKDYDLKEILDKNNITLEELDKLLIDIDYRKEKANEKFEQFEVLDNSIGKFCIDKGYYYPLIYRLIEKSNYKGINLVNIIEDYKKNSRKHSTGFLTTKDQRLLNEELIKLGLYGSYTIIDIDYYRYTPEEAIMNAVFRKKTNEEEKWLEVIYDYYIENDVMKKEIDYGFNIEYIKQLLTSIEKEKLKELVCTCIIKLEKYEENKNLINNQKNI